jgi:hypothetical protein
MEKPGAYAKGNRRSEPTENDRTAEIISANVDALGEAGPVRVSHRVSWDKQGVPGKMYCIPLGERNQDRGWIYQ